MKIHNHDDNISRAVCRQKYSFMPSGCFALLMAGPRGCGKTNTLYEILTAPLVSYDRLFVYAKNLHQQKLQKLQAHFDAIANDPEWIKNCGASKPAHFSSANIIPLANMDGNSNLHTLVVFDDFIEGNKEEQRLISEYFTQGRHKNCSVIYLSQSYYTTPKNVRLNCTHFCIFAIPSRRERQSILLDLGVSKEQYGAATAQPYDFLYVDKIRNTVAKNFDEPV